MKKQHIKYNLTQEELKRVKRADKKIKAYYKNFCNSFDQLERQIIFLTRNTPKNSLSLTLDLINECEEKGDFYADDDILFFLKRARLFTHNSQLLLDLKYEASVLRKFLYEKI